MENLQRSLSPEPERAIPKSFPSLVLENERLQVTLRPDLGGRIDQILDRRTGKAWLWHPSGYRGEARALPVGASFDEHWTGGWDEVFPNDVAGTFRGRHLADHGELWSQRWKVLSQSENQTVIAYALTTVPVTVTKEIRLIAERQDEGARVEVRYHLKNESDEKLPFLFKLHAALAIEPGDQILMPPCQIEPVTLDFSTWIGQSGRTPFPEARNRRGEGIRVDTAPEASQGIQEFVYATGLREGWSGILSRRTGSRIRFQFDLATLPFVWLFQSYGKWKGHYVLVMEPCSNVPYDLNEALQQGTCAILEARAELDFCVQAVIENEA